MKKINNRAPGNESRPLPGLTYMTFNSSSITKEDARKRFKERYNQDPEIIFLGPPKGTLIYAGPVNDNRADLVLIQPALL